MQINPVAVIHKAELLESDNRLGRCQAEGNTITPTPALYQRTGIDTQIESGISLRIHIIQGKFGIFITDFPRQCTAEDKLRVLWTINDTTLQLHACSILADSEENSIQLQGVHTQTMYSSTPIDTSSGGSAETQHKIIKRNILSCQEITDRVLFAGFQLHAG